MVKKRTSRPRRPKASGAKPEEPVRVRGPRSRAANPQPDGRPAEPTTSPERRGAAPSEKIFPIVGIGASAGGLEAVTQLLKSLPRGPDMALVLVQHLAPKHESMLTSLLSNATSLPVTEVTEGMRV